MTIIRAKVVLNSIPIELESLVPNGEEKRPGLLYKNIPLCSNISLINKSKKEFLLITSSSEDILDSISVGDTFSLLGGRNSELAKGEIIEVYKSKKISVFLMH